MRVIDLLGFTALALIVGLAMGWTIGFHRGRSRGVAEGEAKCRDNENRLQELQRQVKQLLGVSDEL